VRGTLTHKRTSSKSAGIRLAVTGKMTVAKGGKVTADERSSFQSTCRSGGCYAMSYGGTGTPPSWSYSNLAYGSVSDPDDLGSFATSYSDYYPGGLVLVTAGSLDLAGEISARGKRLSSGGTVNMKITGAGAITGSGAIDVSVVRQSSGCDGNSNGGGGGRVPVTGFGSITTAVLDNVKMDGNPSCRSGAGTYVESRMLSPLLPASLFTWRRVAGCGTFVPCLVESVSLSKHI
jgi:hypothetical protein